MFSLFQGTLLDNCSMGTLEFFFILCLFLARLFVFSLCQVYLVSWFRFTVSSHGTFVTAVSFLRSP